MKKIFVSLTLVLLLVLVAASTVTAVGNTPSGGPRGNTPMRGRVINLATIRAGVTANVHLIDDYGSCYDLQATRSGNLVLMEGITLVEPGWYWAVIGEALIVKQKIADMYLDVINPDADACKGVWVDSYTMFGSSLVRNFVGGPWENYCDGEVYNSGTWMGAFYTGACP